MKPIFSSLAIGALLFSVPGFAEDTSTTTTSPGSTGMSGTSDTTTGATGTTGSTTGTTTGSMGSTGTTDDTTRTSSASSSRSAKQVKVTDINKNPGSYVGKKVMLQGEVDESFSDGMFVLDGEGFFNDKILVINSATSRPGAAGTTGTTGSTTASAPTFNKDENVKVTGTVRRLTVSQIEREYKAKPTPEMRSEVRSTTFPVIVTDLSTVQRSSGSDTTSSSSAAE